MKVLVFTSLYPNNVWPRHGVFIKERMTHFAKNVDGHIRVMAPVPYFPPIKINQRWRFSQVAHAEEIDGVNVQHPRYLMIPKVGMVLHGLLMFLSLYLRVKRVQKDFDFDLIDSHYAYPDGFAAVLIGQLLRKPVIISARGSDVNLFRTFPLVQRLLRFAFLRAERIIAVSQALKDAILQLGIPEEKVEVIPNGVDLEKFKPIPTDEARKRLKLRGNSLLVSVGNLNPNKGFDKLIKSVRILSEQESHKDIHLVIIGEGPELKNLQGLVHALGLEKRVSFAGGVPHQELFLWYSAADIVCLASGREGWPNVLLEAMACSKPVVATAVGGIPEIVSSNELGILVKRNEMEIASGISQALSKEWNSQKIRKYAETHTWNRVTESLEETFRSATKEYNKRNVSSPCVQ